MERTCAKCYLITRGVKKNLPNAVLCSKCSYGIHVYSFPEYHLDLNLIHRAEQKVWLMDWNLRHDFITELAKKLNPVQWKALDSPEDFLDASAEDRTYALSMAIQKNYGKLQLK